jgi:hypothetical protein
MVVEPPAGDDGAPVERRDALLCEEGGQDVADHAPDSVRREDLKN